MSHKCTHALIRCMDFRLGPHFKHWLAENGYLGDIDNISIAGACKDFLDCENQQAAEFLMSQIDKSVKLHDIAKVILTQHTDCGAYGGEKAFADKDEERNKLVSDMAALRELIKNRYPALDIVMVLVKKADQGNWDFEHIIF